MRLQRVGHRTVGHTDSVADAVLIGVSVEPRDQPTAVHMAELDRDLAGGNSVCAIGAGAVSNTRPHQDASARARGKLRAMEAYGRLLVGARTLSRARLAGELAVLAPTLALPMYAAAADTLIIFDDQPSGTALNTQYSAQGVVFGEGPLGPFYPGGTVRMPTNASEAHSPPNVLDITRTCGEPQPASEVWGRFAAPRNHVSLWAGCSSRSSSAPMK